MGSMKEYYHATSALTSASIAGSKSEMVSFPPSSDPAYTSLPTNASQPTTATTTRQPLYRRSPLLFVGGGVALLLFTALLVVVERRPNNNLHGTATTSAGGSAGTPGSSEYAIQQKTKKRICDPHDLPGVLHIAENIDSIRGALETTWRPIHSDSCPPQSYTTRIASSNLSSIPTALYNRTILLIGDSIDRANTQYTCHLLSGNYTITKPGDPHWPQDDIPSTLEKGWKPNAYSERSYPTICHIESIDLLIMNVFHFGLDQEDYFTWKDQYGPPYTVEERIQQIALHLIEKVGRKVDILEFSSGLWDLARFGRQDDSLLTSESTTTVRHLTLERLQWFNTRFISILQLLNDKLPSSLIKQRYVRHLHKSSDDDAGSFQQWWQVGGGGEKGDKHTYYFPSWRVDELNMATLDAVQHVNEEVLGASGDSASLLGRWNIDSWGAKLSGMELFDKGNVHPHYAATTLWLEQMFYRLLNGSGS